MKILVLDANPKTSVHAHSKWAYEKLEKDLIKNNEVKVWPLYQMDIPVIDEDVFSAWEKKSNNIALTEVESNKMDRRTELLNDFLHYDHYIIVSPLWNFGVPPQLKALIDTIAVAGKTFVYSETGPVGLLKGSFAHIQATGGVYSGSPESEFGHRYIRHLFQFLGLKPLEPLLMEGTNMGLFDRDAFTPTLNSWVNDTVEALEV